MRFLAVIYLLLGGVLCQISFGQSSVYYAQDHAKITEVKGEILGDSAQVRIRFKKLLPEKYRIGFVNDSAGKILMVGAFKKTAVDIHVRNADLPDWIRVFQVKEDSSEITRVVMNLQKDVAYKSSWDGNDLVIRFPNKIVSDRSYWKNPWIYAGVGAIAVVGTVLWLSPGTDEPSKNNDIEAPDIQLPD